MSWADGWGMVKPLGTYVSDRTGLKVIKDICMDGNLPVLVRKRVILPSNSKLKKQGVDEILFTRKPNSDLKSLYLIRGEKCYAGATTIDGYIPHKIENWLDSMRNTIKGMLEGRIYADDKGWHYITSK